MTTDATHVAAITDVNEFIDTLGRIVKRASVVDPTLVQELFAARRAHDPLEELTPGEREVLALMAEGRSNAGIARQLWVTEGTGREARAQHPDEASSPGDRGRSPQGSGRDHVPRRPLASVNPSA